MYKKERKSWMKHLDFTILDIICLELAYALSYFMRFGRKNEFLNEEYQRLAVVLILIDICVVFFGESYKSILRRKNTQEFKHVVVHATIIVAGMMVYGYWTRQSDFSRQIFLMFWGLSMIFEFVGRSGLKNFIKKKMMNDRNLSAMIVVTTDELVESCLKEFENLPYREFAVHGVVVVDAMRKGEIIRGIPVVANADDFFEYVKNNVVDEVFINGNTIASSQALADDLLEMGVTVHFNLVHASKLMPNKVIEQCGNYMVLTSSMCIATPRQLFFKRLMDIVGGFVGLVIAGIATIIFAPIIKKQSPGPIFFSQIRVGKNGRKFRFYKFRSMKVNKESDTLQATLNDPRKTKFGDFMRRTNIDELPQFINVLLGDMSIVGPRPHMLKHTEEYSKIINKYMVRHFIKPGITGWAQVTGFRGETRELEDMEGRVKADIWYMEHWSFLLDLYIMYKTVANVLRKDKQAY